MLAKQYLSLEQWRLGSRLAVHWHLPEKIPDLAVPALTIQPLLENAIRHGVEGCIQGGEVNIQLTQTQVAITLLITNPVCDIRNSSSHNGVALANISQRLQLFFGVDANISCVENSGEYSVKLVLPRQHNETLA